MLLHGHYVRWKIKIYIIGVIAWIFRWLKVHHRDALYKANHYAVMDL